MTQKSLVVPRIFASPVEEKDIFLKTRYSWLLVPIIASHKVIGLVELGRKDDIKFTPEQISWAEAFVVQAAVAIQNAWLFEQARLSNERLHSLARRLVKIQESEREHIARELHDEAGQSLSSLKIGIGRLEQDPDCQPQMQNRLHALKDIVDNVLEDLHRMAMDLRPVALDRLGLVAALEQHVHQLDGDRLSIQFKALGFDSDRLPRDLEVSIYRIVQEALTNILRHAQASQVGILVERAETIKVFVEDDGIGFQPLQVDPTKHMGLSGIRERTEMLRGSMTIESTPGMGTSIIVEVPYVRANSDR